MKKIVLNQDELLMYWNQYLTIQEIADKFECNGSVVRKALKSLGISCDRSIMMQRHYFRIHQDVWQDVKSLLDDGLSIEAVSKRLPVSRDGIKQMIKDYGYKYNHNSFDEYLRSDEYKSCLEALLREHRSVKEMADILGKSERTVSRHLNFFGLTEAVDRVDILDDDVLKDWNDGMTIVDIARKYSCSHDTITKRLKKYGISCTRQKGIERHFDAVHSADWDLIKQDLENCMPVSAVAVKYGLRYEAVYRMMENHNYHYYGLKSIDYDVLEKRLSVAVDDDRPYLMAIKEYYDLYGNAPVVYTLSRYLNLDMKTVRQKLLQYDLMDFVGNNGPSIKVLKVLHDLDAIGVRYDVNNHEVLRDGNSFLEIDIYLPDYKLGIEVNPTWTHSIDTMPYGQEDKLYHQKKSLAAERAGIGLIHLYDSDFVDIRRYNVVLRQIKAMVQPKRKIGARQCEIKQINRDLSNDFLNTYHFQGGENSSSVCYGMFFENILVGVFTVGHSRFQKGYDEIIRYCMHPNYIVIGCFDKFLHCYMQYRNSSDVRLLAYMDLNKRLLGTNVYQKHGFADDGNTVPDYVWISQSGTKFYPRYAVMKSKLLKHGFDESKTESEIMLEQHYCRVFGAGSRRYLYVV